MSKLTFALPIMSLTLPACGPVSQTASVNGQPPGVVIPAPTSLAKPANSAAPSP